MSILNHIINIIFPAVCKQCNDPISADTPTAYFCNNCWDGIKWFDGPCCPHCGLPYHSFEPLSPSPQNPDDPDSNDLSPPDHLCGSCHKNPPYFDRSISGGPYEGILAEAIRLFKYKKKIHIGRVLVKQMMSLPPFIKGDLGGVLGKINRPCYIVPVPLHPKRLREREFNQSAIIASGLGEKLGMSVLPANLIRQRHTKPQVELDFKERKENVVGVFAVQNREVIKDKEIILVDDVYTTGSTVNECAKVLKKNGAGKVYVVTVARMVG